MSNKARKIEVDSETADLLEARAAARHMTLSEFLADLASNESALPADLAAMRARGEGPWSPEALEEDARRLAEFERSRIGVPWNDVKSWLEGWGTSNEGPSPQPRKL